MQGRGIRHAPFVPRMRSSRVAGEVTAFLGTLCVDVFLPLTHLSQMCATYRRFIRQTTICCFKGYVTDYMFSLSTTHGRPGERCTSLTLHRHNSDTRVTPTHTHGSLCLVRPPLLASGLACGCPRLPPVVLVLRRWPSASPSRSRSTEAVQGPTGRHLGAGTGRGPGVRTGSVSRSVAYPSGPPSFSPGPCSSDWPYGTPVLLVLGRRRLRPPHSHPHLRLVTLVRREGSP